MPYRVVQVTIQRCQADRNNTPCCGGQYMPEEPTHAEEGGEIYVCWSCETHFAVVDNDYPVGFSVTFTEIPDQPSPGLTLTVQKHPFV
ncbi:hypothetical protein KKF05_05245 [Patescibacteria group bacterium]|nr:hypothetical protein [Patescibacteria group bacterium]MBU1029135.1 hypothetical protein [Patescibacteria group bacterium]MBU1915950.1 hypothetical protein [Patescibacteria group bacterium]